jgi:N-sulfoglucosamine sulfohydrolase
MADRPNILLITTHDTGRHFGCYGYDTLCTPNIDHIAAEGLRFSNYFATVPICSASRVTMLTGMYPQTHGVVDLAHPVYGWPMRDPNQHLSYVLRNAGYRTHLFGMQHETADPTLLGFDEIHSHDKHDRPHAAAEPVAEQVAAFLDTHRDSDAPFYAQVGFRETHTPFGADNQAPDESRGVEVPPYLVEDDASRAEMALFQGAVQTVDDAVGVISNALAQSGVENDTLLIVTTDHGIEVPRSKWTLYDPGIAIAMIMRWPAGGLVGGEVCDRLMGNVDFMPTLLELVGVTPPDDLEGVSFSDALQDSNAEAPRNAVFGLYQKFEMRSVRTDRFKLIQHFDFPIDFLHLPVAMDQVLERRVVGMVELFDLDADPNEFTNIADEPEYADVRADLCDWLWRWLEFVGDPILVGPTTTPSYRMAQADYAAWRSAAT